MKIFVPGDSAAISVGADEVAAAIAAKVSGATIIRYGSRGALWLEPMVEVETDKGRIAFGPVSVEDIDSLIAADFMHGGNHALSLGETEKIQWLATQDRVTFKRVGIIDPLSIAEYEAHGGLVGLRKAISISSDAIIAEVTESGVRRLSRRY